MGGERGVPHRRDAGLAIGLVVLDHQQQVDRLARDGAGGMVLGIAEDIVHHHRIGHGRIDRAQAVLAVEALGHPFLAQANRFFAQVLGPEPVARLEHGVERVEALGPVPADMGGLAVELGRLADEQLVHQDTLGVPRLGLERAEHQQRHDHGARPVAHLGQVDREPPGREHQLGRDRRHRVPRSGAIERKLDAGEDVASLGPARGMDRGAGTGHVRRVDIVADHLQRIVGLDRGADVEIAVLVERPAMVLVRLAAAQVAADLALQLGIHRLAQIVAEQHVFGGDRGIGFQLEHPVAIVLLGVEQGGGGAADGGFHGSAQLFGGNGIGQHGGSP